MLSFFPLLCDNHSPVKHTLLLFNESTLFRKMRIFQHISEIYFLQDNFDKITTI